MNLAKHVLCFGIFPR